MTYQSAINGRPALYVPQTCTESNDQSKIQRVLIANRGEIACRVIATCRKLNITSIAIYVKEDGSSRHVSDADEAICLQSIQGTERGNTNPYLDIELLVRTALDVRADAIHPGYGYLSENSAFADKVREAALVFIGPSSVAMLTLGNKRSSKVYLREHAPEVPLIPGFAGSSQDIEDLEKAARSIGFPVMVKASAGGGGKGIRIVREASSLRAELERAQSEAKRSFGSGDCILEKYIEAGKHVEFQIVGDKYGRVVSLWDRDCSVQRRHQKVIEETPCPWLSDGMRRVMSKTAIRIGELIGYENAGTVEFVVDIKEAKYYFLEVNARLQVEHPITEEVTGIDLVALQLFVATGGRLDDLKVLEEIPQQGHAIECRLCAEDPHRDFFPEHGTVQLWLPAPGVLGPGRDIRYETAVRTGSEVSIHFDSMIAKIVVWAATRSQAIDKMVKVLANTACVAVRTNQLFLQSCLLHPRFHDPSYTTSFIPDNIEELLKNPYNSKANAAFKSVGVILSLYLRTFRDGNRGASASRPFHYIQPGFRNQKFDPINRSTNLIVTLSEGIKAETAKMDASICLWKLAEGYPRTFDALTCPIPELKTSERAIKSVSREITVRYNSISAIIRGGEMNKGACERVSIDEIIPLSKSEHPNGIQSSSIVHASLNHFKELIILSHQISYDASAASQAAEAQIVYAHIPALGTWAKYEVYSALSFAETMRVGEQDAVTNLKIVKAPMPCKVLRVSKKQGDHVKKGEQVMVVESMKMEISITMPMEGKLGIALKPGDTVEEGALLCEAL